ncbi:3'-5' exonuclease [bacterium]|nr:3'-5' exonuclease [bacterium]
MGAASIQSIDLGQVLFLDIETVPCHPTFADLEPEWQQLWAEKTRWQRKDEISAEDYYPQRAGVMAEFSKVVCICAGYFERSEGTPRSFRIKAYRDENERDLLEAFCIDVERFSDWRLCAHNGKEFDFPFLARRILVHRLPLPRALDAAGRKPWEIPHLDTLELWKFGDFKHYTSLKLLARLFGLPSPKGDIDGSQVQQVYYQDRDLGRIADYCAQDVLCLARLFQAFRGEKPLEEDEWTLRS